MKKLLKKQTEDNINETSVIVDKENKSEKKKSGFLSTLIHSIGFGFVWILEILISLCIAYGGVIFSSMYVTKVVAMAFGKYAVNLIKVPFTQMGNADYFAFFELPCLVALFMISVVLLVCIFFIIRWLHYRAYDLRHLIWEHRSKTLSKSDEN